MYTIKPKIWTLRWERFRHKQLLTFGIVALLASALIIFVSLRNKSDPMQMATRFFRGTEWSTVKKESNSLLSISNGSLRARVWRWTGESDEILNSSEIRSRVFKNAEMERLYVIYDDKLIPARRLHELKTVLSAEIIPLAAQTLEQAIQLSLIHI